MAAAIAHEVKNPLASIEIMAGVLKRQLPDRADALETLLDIIKEAKMANAIVVEVLEFVRPIELQVEPVALDEVINESIVAGRKQARTGGDVQSRRRSIATSPICRPTRTSCGSCSRTC